jgi:hypothetical protein
VLFSNLVIIALFVAFIFAAPVNSVLAQAIEPDLGNAKSFSLLGGSTVTLTNSAVIGDVGVDSGGTITQTTSSVVGTVHLGDLVAEQAYGDFLIAYNNIVAADSEFICNGYSSDAAYTDATLNLPPGVYCTDTALTFTRTKMILDAEGDPDAVWIFKIGTSGIGALTGTNLAVSMINGGQPRNAYWWIANAMTMTTSTVKGNILAGTAITFTDGSMIGRALAKDDVTMTGPDIFGIIIPVTSALSGAVYQAEIVGSSILLPEIMEECSDQCEYICKHCRNNRKCQKACRDCRNHGHGHHGRK